MTAVNGFFSYYTIGCARPEIRIGDVRPNRILLTVAASIFIPLLVTNSQADIVVKAKVVGNEIRFVRIKHTCTHRKAYVYNASNFGDLAL